MRARSIRSRVRASARMGSTLAMHARDESVTLRHRFQEFSRSRAQNLLLQFGARLSISSSSRR